MSLSFTLAEETLAMFVDYAIRTTAKCFIIFENPNQQTCYFTWLIAKWLSRCILKQEMLKRLGTGLFPVECSYVSFFPRNPKYGYRYTSIMFLLVQKPCLSKH